MPRFAEVTHVEWIAAPEARVRSQFADLEHHNAVGVHPNLKLTCLDRSPGGARYEQRVTLLGIPQRDVFERRFTADGGMVDTSIEGFNRGGSLTFSFAPERRGAADGTRVSITIRLPLPPVVGPLIEPLLKAHVRKVVAAAAAEDKFDLEVRGYQARAATGAASGPAGAVVLQT